jgi:aspartyl/asparaginyl-tRNA synthetase
MRTRWLPQISSSTVYYWTPASTTVLSTSGYVAVMIHGSNRETLTCVIQTPTTQSVFKLQAVIGELFRQYLNQHNFMEIHSPKLQGAATESGASVFKVEYFKGT